MSISEESLVRVNYAAMLQTSLYANKELMFLFQGKLLQYYYTCSFIVNRHKKKLTNQTPSQYIILDFNKTPQNHVNECPQKIEKKEKTSAPQHKQITTLLLKSEGESSKSQECTNRSGKR